MNIITVTFDKETWDTLIDLSKIKAATLPKNKHQVMEGARAYIGFLGEYIFVYVFNGVINDDDWQWDVLIKQKKVDVKTKSCKTVPQGNYLADFPARQKSYNCDSYYFIRVDIEKRTAYMLGGVTKENMYSYGKLYEAGEYVEGSPINFRYDVPHWAIPISLLKQPNASSHHSHATS
jgi:hypothetical protein